MSKEKYIDVSRLINTKDRNGKEPNIVIIEGNRNVGKTTSADKFLLDEFINGNGKFILLYRYQTELSQCANKFFNKVKLWYKNDGMYSLARADGRYHELFFCKDNEQDNATSCGFALAINTAEKIKKQDGEFTDVTTMLYDEFQSEFKDYCPYELEKFSSLYSTVARGEGQAFRDVKVIMLGNSTDLDNPYYRALKIPKNVFYDNTMKYRGDGFVCHFYFGEEIAKEVKEKNTVARLFAPEYLQYSTGFKHYLNDISNLVTDESLTNYTYVYTIVYDNKCFGLFTNNLKVRMTESYDKQAKKYAIDKSSIKSDVPLLNPKSRKLLKEFINSGNFSISSPKLVDVVLSI